MSLKEWRRAGLLSLSLAAWSAGASFAAQRPLGIVLVTLDAVRADHLSAYGYGRRTTPVLDSIASGGVVYSHAYSQASWTLPSLMSLMTSRFPEQHGFERFLALPGKWFPTLASVLRSKGYRTGAFISGLPVHASYDVASGFSFKYHGREKGDSALLLRSAIHWLSRDIEQPFLIWIHANDAHEPRICPDDYMYRYVPAISRFIGKKPSATDRYDGCISYIDSQVQQLKDFFESHGMSRDVLWVITSDHGEYLGEHGRKGPSSTGHGYDLYEPQVRVPLIMAHSSLKPGRVDSPVMLIDVLPTVLGLLDLSPLKTAQGEDLINRSAWKTRCLDGFAYSSVYRHIPSSDGRLRQSEHRIWMVRGGSWKLIWLKGRGELYDLKTDPMERRNVINARPDQYLRLARCYLDEVISRVDSVLP